MTEESQIRNVPDNKPSREKNYGHLKKNKEMFRVKQIINPQKEEEKKIISFYY